MSGRLVDYIASGAAASLPTAATLDASLATGAAAFYYATDTNVLYTLNRSGTPAWKVVSPGTQQLGTKEFTTAAATHTFDVSGLTDINHLRLTFAIRSAAASPNDTLWVRFNSDSGGNYENANHYFGTGAGHSVAGGQGQTGGACAAVNAASSTAGAASFSMGEILIPYFRKTQYRKQWMARNVGSVSTTDTRGYNYHGEWNNAAAITSVTFVFSSSANFVVDSQIDIYGEK